MKGVFEKTYQVIQSSSKHQYGLSIWKVINQEITLQENQVDLTFDKLIKQLDKTCPIILHLNSDVVISKKGKTLKEFNEGLKQNEFYIDYLQTETTEFLSAIHQEYLNSIVEKFNSEKLLISSVYFGNSIRHVLPIDFDYSLETQNIEGLTLTKQLYPAFAVILTYLNPPKQLGNLNSLNISLFEQSNYQIKSRWIQLIGISVVFLGLLINFLVFQNINSKLTSVQTEQNLIQTYKLKRDSIKAQFNRLVLNQKTILKEHPPLAYMFDQIFICMPENIEMESIEYQTLLEKPSKRKKISYNSNTINLDVLTTSPIQVNKWLDSLNKRTFIKSSSIEKISLNKKGQNEVSITIKLKS